MLNLTLPSLSFSVTTKTTEAIAARCIGFNPAVPPFLSTSSWEKEGHPGGRADSRPSARTFKASWQRQQTTSHPASQ
ncbi:hypothetical protein V5799_021381 [Amblyomma americanum]|uniref:Uncharacterized protein n=1 Tax=Amblyomma americanum TaxID=6943 RepID=A0AAQ4FPY2_AMBAM